MEFLQLYGGAVLKEAEAQTFYMSCLLSVTGSRVPVTDTRYEGIVWPLRESQPSTGADCLVYLHKGGY